MATMASVIRISMRERPTAPRLRGLVVQAAVGRGVDRLAGVRRRRPARPRRPCHRRAGPVVGLRHRNQRMGRAGAQSAAHQWRPRRRRRWRPSRTAHRLDRGPVGRRQRTGDSPPRRRAHRSLPAHRQRRGARALASRWRARWGWPPPTGASRRAGPRTFASTDATIRASAPPGSASCSSKATTANSPFPLGRSAELWREGEKKATHYAWGETQTDEFADWTARANRDDDRATVPGYVSPEMTGAEDLDRYGRWDTHADYGPIWTPTTVVAGWAPYRYGHWAVVRPWGWTWVDYAPWGFAPFHYGRWVYIGGSWCWAPGHRVARPVYSPAHGGVDRRHRLRQGPVAVPRLGAAGAARTLLSALHRRLPLLARGELGAAGSVSARYAAPSANRRHAVRQSGCRGRGERGAGQFADAAAPGGTRGGAGRPDCAQQFCQSTVAHARAAAGSGTADRSARSRGRDAGHAAAPARAAPAPARSAAVAGRDGAARRADGHSGARWTPRARAAYRAGAAFGLARHRTVGSGNDHAARRAKAAGATGPRGAARRPQAPDATRQPSAASVTACRPVVAAPGAGAGASGTPCGAATGARCSAGSGGTARSRRTTGCTAPCASRRAAVTRTCRARRPGRPLARSVVWPCLPTPAPQARAMPAPPAVAPAPRHAERVAPPHAARQPVAQPREPTAHVGQARVHLPESRGHPSRAQMR